jgi:CRP/FNR family transcriptional regulator, cyclic AMP receptor protein
MVIEFAAVEKILTPFPVATYRAGDMVLGAGSKTGRLLFLKSGAVVVLKDSIEIAKVDQRGAVFGELSALLDQPHAADVKAAEDSEFYVADTSLLEKYPIAVIHVAGILAQRLTLADTGLVELGKRLQAGDSPNTLRRMLRKIQQGLTGANFEPGL